MPNRFGKKTMLCVWWDQSGIVYYEFLKAAKPVKDTLKSLGFGILPHPLYSPNPAPSDYHLFASMGHALAEQHFSNFEEVRKWLGE
ncbi:mariner Mos1 transposase [Trichonephila clavipes]|nr:mariner Mos1 transposase [Trichonephila clavipes]